MLAEGCRLGQGHLYSRPVDAVTLSALLHPVPARRSAVGPPLPV